MLWRRRCGQEASQQARQDGFHVEAAIEAELELSEVAVRVLGEVEGVVGAPDGGFQVAQQRVDGLELRQLHAGLATASDDALMLGADHGGGTEAPQPVRDDGGGRGNVPGSECGHRLAGGWLGAQARVQRTAFAAGLDSGHEGDLVVGAAPGLAAGELAAEVSVIDLDAPVEFAVELG